MALKESDQRNGEENLGDLESGGNGGRREPVSRDRFEKTITAAIKEFVKELDEVNVHRLCKGGSIWIDKDDARFGAVDQDSFEVMGHTSDSRVTDYGERIGACCLIDFDGLADGFVFDDGADDYEDEMDAETEEMLYSEEKGRKALLYCVEASLDGDLDRVWCQELED